MSSFFIFRSNFAKVTHDPIQEPLFTAESPILIHHSLFDAIVLSALVLRRRAVRTLTTNRSVTWFLGSIQLGFVQRWSTIWQWLACIV